MSLTEVELRIWSNRTNPSNEAERENSQVRDPAEAIRILRRVQGGNSGWGWQMRQRREKREIDEGRRAGHYLVDIMGRNMRVAP